jgi:hypothetical protein
MAIEKMRLMQYGKETVKGTAVAATRILPVIVPPIQPDRKPTYPREDVGVNVDAVRSYISGRLVKDKMSWDSAYFQSLPLLFSCGIKGGVTPVEQTTGQKDYLWTFDPVYDHTSNNQDSITLERGDDEMMVESEYVMFERFKLSGECNQEGQDSAMRIEANYFGRQNTKASFTGGLNIPKLTTINSKLTQFFLDSTWATLGTTQKASTLRAYDIEILTGLHPKFHGSSNEYFDTHGQGPMAVMGAFTFEGNANAEAIFDAMNTQALQAVRLLIHGPKIGTTNNPHMLQIDFCGTWEDVIPLASASNGNNLWTAVLHGMYDTTAKKLLTIKVATDQNTI